MLALLLTLLEEGKRELALADIVIKKTNQEMVGSQTG
jgi:hypothetical protein